MPNVRINQSAVEFISLHSPNVRVCQSPIEFIAVAIPATISCGNPPDGFQGVFYSQTFPASGGLAPYTFAISAGALPTGLTLDTATGIASGIPTAAGAFTFTVLVVDALLNSASVQCSITILASLRITLRGVKRTRCEPIAPELAAEIDTPEDVDRAV